MALHLAEGSVHTVQTPSSYLGYKTLREMDYDNDTLPMKDSEIITLWENCIKMHDEAKQTNSFFNSYWGGWCRS